MKTLSTSSRQIARRQKRALAKAAASQPMNEKVTEALEAIRDCSRYDEVASFHFAGLDNANDTVYTEQQAPVSEFEAIYLESVRCALAFSTPRPSKAIIAFYVDLGIEF